METNRTLTTDKTIRTSYTDKDLQEASKAWIGAVNQLSADLESLEEALKKLDKSDKPAKDTNATKSWLDKLKGVSLMEDAIVCTLFVVSFLIWGLSKPAVNIEPKLPARDDSAPINYFPEPELDFEEISPTRLANHTPQSQEELAPTLTIRQLKKIASEHKVRGYSRMTKQELKRELNALLPAMV